MCRSEKNQGQRGHRKVKYEIGQASVMINLYVKFNVHSLLRETSYNAKIGGQTDGRMDERSRLVTTIGICQNFG